MSQIIAHFLYHANSCFYNYKSSLLILRQHRLASYETLEKNRYVVKMTSNKGNAVVILDQKLYNNAIQEIN